MNEHEDQLKTVVDGEFTEILSRFVDSTTSMIIMLPEILVIVGSMNHMWRKKLDELETKKNEAILSSTQEFSRTFGKLKNSFYLHTHLPSSIFVSMVCQFDYLVESLIKIIYQQYPGILCCNEKNISLSELDEFDNIGDFRSYYIDKEISNLTYKGIKDVFDWFSKRLKKDEFNMLLEDHASIVEVIQRRHTYVHHGGKATRQYIKLTDNPFEVVLEDLLTLDADYIQKAYETMFIVGVKTLFMVWYCVNRSEFLFDQVIDLAFQSIVAEKYDVAVNVLKFGLDIDKKNICKEDMKRILILNLAQSYKWMGKNDICLEILNKSDWTAVEDKFKLGHFCLKEDFVAASRIMKSIGSDGSIGENEYLEWPIFKEFRNTAIFKETFKSIFMKDPDVQVEKLYEGITINYIVTKSQDEFEKHFPTLKNDAPKDESETHEHCNGKAAEYS